MAARDRRSATQFPPRRNMSVTCCILTSIARFRGPGEALPQDDTRKSESQPQQLTRFSDRLALGFRSENTDSGSETSQSESHADSLCPSNKIVRDTALYNQHIRLVFTLLQMKIETQAAAWRFRNFTVRKPRRQLVPLQQDSERYCSLQSTHTPCLYLAPNEDCSRAQSSCLNKSQYGGQRHKPQHGRDAISQTTVTFSSSLDFVDKEHIYRIFDPARPEYVGNEAEEIDRNWDALILPADIYISDEEARGVGGNLSRSHETGKFKIELEVFHSLHCLNMLRKRIYSDLYPEMLAHNADIHIDHCVESLRELIMCSGNMTPIPLEWSEKGERLNPNYASTHTCRDFGKLKDWTIGRSKEGA
ncbi:uncharacterized protein PAC_18957 [Phialocephala subalpina]|uniref:Uncharacterized protein n=1 Tax=Phialocephala subalpina TaxID=576137 RepID=A0A1L7XVJ5_9HELO|nr:uncharacterized protein PAC_18957 [Phialocephala subalpina]